MENYEQKYNAALERARELSKTVTGAQYEYIFPELKEKLEEKNEKIRKGLIKAFRTVGKFEWGGLNVQDILTWLEKQGEQNTLNADDVIEWLRQNICTACYNDSDITLSQRIEKFKKDFEL